MIAEDRPGAAGARSRELTSPAASAPASETIASPSSESAPELTTLELEALLFVAERPLTRREIASLAGVDAASVDARLGDLQVDLADRGIRLLAAGDRVALATAPEAGSLISRYVGAEGVRLTPAALETLAIVAYRQPVTRAAIERILRRRLRLRPAIAAPPSVDHRAGSLRCTGPAHSVRHVLRVPRALRAYLS